MGGCPGAVDPRSIAKVLDAMRGRRHVPVAKFQGRKSYQCCIIAELTMPGSFTELADKEESIQVVTAIFTTNARGTGWHDSASVSEGDAQLQSKVFQKLMK